MYTQRNAEKKDRMLVRITLKSAVLGKKFLYLNLLVRRGGHLRNSACPTCFPFDFKDLIRMKIKCTVDNRLLCQNRILSP